ncbi:MAG: response regulator transcription factor [Nocardioides sp.]|uniref:response regulator n=1 Tax=Nocardioides sp. TaxID=35761 RepID=UPI0039E71B98
MISVVLADDQALIRSALRQLIAYTEDIEVTGEVEDGEAAVRAAERLRPDVVLMDLRMPRLDGVRATEAICGLGLHTRVLVVTTYENEANVLAALRAGASGFIGKSARPHDILHAIRTVHEGEGLLSPRATRMLISRYTADAPAAAVPSTAYLARLTVREREVLRLVGLGLSNTEISRRLGISPVTAKTHVNRTMTKLAVHERAQLVILAYESGLVTPRGVG